MIARNKVVGIDGRPYAIDEPTIKERLAAAVTLALRILRVGMVLLTIGAIGGYGVMLYLFIDAGFKSPFDALCTLLASCILLGFGTWSWAVLIGKPREIHVWHERRSW